MKKQSGITLIALVITIIVLLILAGVSISLVMGQNGVLNKAQKSVKDNRDAEVVEQIKLAYSTYEMAKIDNTREKANKLAEDNLKEFFDDDGLSVKETNGIFVVKLSNNGQYIYDSKAEKLLDELPVSVYQEIAADVEAIENSIYKSDGKVAIIPKGYRVSNVLSEQDIDTGLVVKDGSGNEWVWIPVSASDLALMYSESTTGWTMLSSSGNNNAVITNYKSNSRTDISQSLTRVNPGYNQSGYREPEILNNYSYDGSSSNLSKAGLGANMVEAATNLKEDYKNMIDSLAKYGGFYIGRYELSNDGNKKNKAPLTNKNWYELYAKCKTFGNTSTESRMIWGCQWDQVCKFITTAKDANGDPININNSSKYGNVETAQAPANGGNFQKGKLKNTGSNEAWKLNNIYDLAGNCLEWTQEADITVATDSSGRVWRVRALRGGVACNTGGLNVLSKSGGSGNGFTTSTSTWDCTRAILYIK